MDKITKKFTLFALIVAALSFTACGGDDEIEGGENRNGATLKIDEKAYYVDASIQKSYWGGLYLFIYARESRVNFGPDMKLEISLSGCSSVSELKAGQSFDFEDVSVDNIENVSVVALYEKSYETLSGSITVLSVDKYRVKLKFNELKFKLDFSSNIFGDDYEPTNPKIHSVDGTATFTSGKFDRDGNELPFD